NGDGVISLLLGADAGLTLDRLFSRADVRHPTDVELGNDHSVFYVTQEGQESVAQFSFNEEPVAGFTLDLGIAVPLPGLGSHGSEPGQRLSDLAALGDSRFPTVAVLATVASDSAAPAREAPESGEATLSGLSLAVVSLVAGIPEQRA